jgi:phospholipase C
MAPALRYSHKTPAGRVRHRAYRCRDDGEPELRSFPRLAAQRRRNAGGAQLHATHALAPDFTGYSHPDPDHSCAGGRVQYDNGAMDGFLRSGKNDDYAIGYYVEGDRPFYSALARTTLDPSFCSILGPTDRLSGGLRRLKQRTLW